MWLFRLLERCDQQQHGKILQLQSLCCIKSNKSNTAPYTITLSYKASKYAMITLGKLWPLSAFIGLVGQRTLHHEPSNHRRKSRKTICTISCQSNKCWSNVTIVGANLFFVSKWDHLHCWVAGTKMRAQCQKVQPGTELTLWHHHGLKRLHSPTRHPNECKYICTPCLSHYFKLGSQLKFTIHSTISNEKGWLQQWPSPMFCTLQGSGKVLGLLSNYHNTIISAAALSLQRLSLASTHHEYALE